MYKKTGDFLLLFFVLLTLYVGQNILKANNIIPSKEETIFDEQLSDYMSHLSERDRIIMSAYNDHSSNIQVAGEGTIVKILSNDEKQNLHQQKFMVMLKSGLSLLIIHDTDLAPKLENLKTGSPISFYGMYEYNSQGGAIRHTHQDPTNQHETGWLQYDGKHYQ